MRRVRIGAGGGRLAGAAVLVGALAAVLALTACSGTHRGSGATSHGVDAQRPVTPASPPTTPTGSPTGSPPGTAHSPARPTGTAAPTDTGTPRPLDVVSVQAGRRRYRIAVWARTGADNCLLHAYGGPVRSYLRRHPCSSLQRLLATTTVGGRPVGLALSNVDFAGPQPEVYAVARDFRALELQQGTGSIADMLREGWQLPVGPQSVPQPDAFAAYAQDSVVSIMDAWYTDRPTPANDPPLERLERDVFLQL